MCGSTWPRLQHNQLYDGVYLKEMVSVKNNKTDKPLKENKTRPEYGRVTTMPTSVNENVTIAIKPSSIPLNMNDKIEEKFVQSDENGTINVKSNLGSDVTQWGSRITAGVWIVKDDQKERKRRYTEEKEETKDFCAENVPENWRCLKYEDTFSSEASLRLLTEGNSIGIGVLAVAPANNYNNSFEELSKVKNLIALSLPSKIDAKQLMFTLKKVSNFYDFKASTRALWNLRDFVEIKEIVGSKVFESLKEFGISMYLPFGRFLNSIIDRVVNLPRIKILISEKILTSDLKIEYKDNRLSAWKLFTPRIGQVNLAGQIKITVRSGFQPGIKDLMIKLDDKNMVTLKIKISGVATKIVLTLPKHYRLPAVPFNLRDYEGFKVGDVVTSIMSGGDEDGAIIGLALAKPTTSKIGQWQFHCETCQKWTSLIDAFGVVKPATRNRRQIIDDTECFYKAGTTAKIILLSAETRLKFVPDKLGYFWKSSEAWLNTVIDLSLFKISKPDGYVMANDTFYAKAKSVLENAGAIVVTGTYKLDPDCDIDAPYDQNQVLDFTKLLSEERVKLSIERLGCDGKRSSMKVLTDRCGVCGGNGKSCVDCNGDINGTAYIDQCRKCVGGGTRRKPTKLDCANSCFNTSYYDDCNFCQKRGKEAKNIKDCTGICHGKAYIDRCGACRFENRSLAEVLVDKTKILDKCGVCGGDNTKCIGCDGILNSPKKLDRCGDCKLENDTTFDKGCGKVYLIDGTIPPVLVVRKIGDVIKFAITGYFDTYEKATCSLHQLVQNGKVVQLGEYAITREQRTISVKKDDGKTVHGIAIKVNSTSLFPDEVKFTKWNISCSSSEDGYSSTARYMVPFMVRDLNPWSLKSLEPLYFEVSQGGGDVTITGEDFPSKDELMCVAPRYVYVSHGSSKSAVKLKKLQVIKTPTTYVSDTQVKCTFPNVTTPTKIRIHVIPKYEAEKSSDWAIARNVEDGLAFEFRAKAPGILEARLGESLSEIDVTFDTDISFIKKVGSGAGCVALEENLDLLGEKPWCMIRGSKLIIRPGKKPVAIAASGRSSTDNSSIGDIVIKEGTIATRSSDGASQPFPRTTVPILKPLKMKPPDVVLRGPVVLEPCEEANLIVIAYPNVGLWPLTFHWSAVVEENPVNNTADSITDFLAKQTQGTRGKRISFKNFEGKLQPGANYTISVKVTNYFGLESKTAESSFHIRSHYSSVRASISDRLLEVPSDQDITLKLKSKFLKPICIGATSAVKMTASRAAEMTLSYIWEAETTDGISIPMDSDVNIEATKRSLKLPAGFLKPGNYTIKATAIYYDSDVKQGEASVTATIIVSSSPIIAQVKSLFGSVIMSDEDLTLYSRSRDPDGGTLTYSWSCEMLDGGGPCLVIKEGATDIVEIAEVAFVRYLSSDKDTLTIPAKLFKEFSDMKITLMVRSGDREETSSIKIRIKDASDNLPTIRTRPIADDQAFIPSKPLRVKATITGNERKTWMMIVTWSCVEEDGYSFIELSDAAVTTLQKELEINEKPSRIDLVLKKGVLEPGSSYKFLVEAVPDFTIHPLEEGKDESDMTVYSEIIVKVIDALPTGGNIVVEPSSGTALSTKFNIRADGWVGGNENQPLMYKFAYTTKNAEGKRRSLTSIGEFSDSSSVSSYLPPGDPDRGDKLVLYSFVQIGENKNTIGSVITQVIVLPIASDNTTGSPVVDEEVVQDMVNEAVQALVAGDRSETFSKVLLIGKSVSGDNVRKKEVLDLAESAIKQMNSFTPSSETDALDALESVSSVISTFSDDDLTTSSESKEIALNVISRILKDLYDQADPSSRRRRRAIETESTVNTIPVDMAERMLSLFDNIFLSPGNDATLVANTKIKFKEDTEFIMKSFCNAVAYDEPIQIAQTDYSLVGSRKVPMPYGDSYVTGPLLFSFSEDIEAQYSNWHCDSSTNNTCPGACVAYGRYMNDVIQSDATSDDAKATRISPIAAFFIRNPTDGEDASNLANTTGLTKTISITFKNLTISTDGNTIVQCRHLDVSVWSTGRCMVTWVSATEVFCQCNVHFGYFSVFVYSNDTVESTTTDSSTSTLITTPVSNVTDPTDTDTTNSAVTCNAPAKLAVTCSRQCLDYCHKESDTCKEKCVPMKSCICPVGAEKLGGLCVLNPECDDEEPGNNSLSTAAIVGLTIAIIAVSVALLVLLYLYYKKSKRGQVTPTNSSVEIGGDNRMNNPPKYNETKLGDDDRGALLTNEDAGPSGVKNSTFRPESVSDPPPEYSEKPKELDAGGVSDPDSEAD
uniref:uncharacterized protein LOC120333377 n=1 Tax=Styela clava TaxID=7725 RepID=UPI00193AD00B|nr:uncharacterized protein LOC120333377 [Styela clava]